MSKEKKKSSEAKRTAQNSYYLRDLGPEWGEFRKFCDTRGLDYKWALVWFVRNLPKDEFMLRRMLKLEEVTA